MIMNFSDEILQTYIIDRPIGEGGGGVVYLATHKRLQKKVVLKKIRGEITDFVNCRTEVDILKNLRHSYLPQVIDFIESSDGIFTVMDYIDGESLQQKLDRGYKFTEKEVRKYAEQLCEAVEYLHSQNPPIIHGDIKPENVMVTQNGDICLIDFNISGFLSGKSIETIGYTPGYSSPEQIQAFEQASENKTERTEIGEAGIGSEPTVLGSSGIGSEATVIGSTDNSSGHKVITEKKPAVSKIIVDTRSDIYSIGATVYAVIGGDIRLLSKGKRLSFPGKVSDGMRIILSKAVEQRAKRRYQSTAAMLEALRQVQKMDSAYRHLIRKQHLKIFLYCLTVAVAVILIVLGSQKLEDEKEERYEKAISYLETSTEDGLVKDKMEELFAEATDIHEDRVEPYYYKAYYLYLQNYGEELIKFADSLEDINLIGNQELRSRIWYLTADCLFEEKRYAEAEWYYYLAISDDADNISLYRDYAISLIYGGKLIEAEKTLEEATEKGMKDADIYMVRGELARIREEYDEAAGFFKKVTEMAQDDHLMLRATVNYARCCSEIGTKKKLKAGIKVLECTLKELPMDSRLLVYEELGSAYIKIAELENDKDYYAKAVKTYESIVEMSWGNEVTYSNLIVLNQRLKNYAEAMEWAEKMCDRYPDNYVSFMRLAFAEIEIQNEKNEKNREYENFAAYYKKAEELYQRSVSKGKVDSEMLLLEDTYKKLQGGGWIE